MDLDFLISQWNNRLAFLIPLAILWSGYVGYELRNLATIKNWEVLCLLPFCCIPMFAFFVVADQTVIPVWIVVSVSWIGLSIVRNDKRRIGSFSHEGQLRILGIGRKKGQLINSEQDLKNIDVLVLSKSDYENLKNGNSAKLQDLLIKAINQDIEILPVSGFLQEEYGYIDLHERDEAKQIGLRRRRILRGTKRVVDTIITLTILVGAFPVIILISGVLQFFQGGPIFFSQDRLGKGGKAFQIIKFRTMEETETGDQRVTKIGKFLRWSHLDELPQFFNILRGDMAIIGPRPEWVLLSTPDLAPEDYWLRQAIRPGLTGWAQVVYKPSRTKTMRQRKLGYDLYYVKHRSVMLDILIWFRTLRQVPVLFFSYVRERIVDNF